MSTTEHVPAWKRAGLVQKKSAAQDFVKTQNKKLEQSVKRNADSKGSDGPKKPPKRQKLPKDQRKPPPEADQLAYLRQFHDDRANWKFSKQKQNWLLRNFFDIASTYEDALQSYVAEIQGASKQRVIEDANDVVAKWNKYMSEPVDNRALETVEPVKSKEADSAKKPTRGILKNSQGQIPEEPVSSMSPAKPAAPAPAEKPPTETAAKRAQSILRSLTGTTPDLELLD